MQKVRLVMSKKHGKKPKRTVLRADPNFFAIQQHHRIPFVPAALPPYSELNGELFDRASELFDGSHAWTDGYALHGRHYALEVNWAQPDRLFYIKSYSFEECLRLKPVDVINWAHQNGYRVTTEAELRAFGLWHEIRPLLKLGRYSIAALGSFVFDQGVRKAAVLYTYAEKLGLGTMSFDGSLYETSFLLVRVLPLEVSP